MLHEATLKQQKVSNFPRWCTAAWIRNSSPFISNRTNKTFKIDVKLTLPKEFFWYFRLFLWHRCMFRWLQMTSPGQVSSDSLITYGSYDCYWEGGGQWGGGWLVMWSVLCSGSHWGRNTIDLCIIRRVYSCSLIINIIIKVLKQGQVDAVLTSAEARPTSAVGEFMWSDGLLSDITDTAGKEQSELPVISPAQTDRSKWANQNRAGFNHAV